MSVQATRSLWEALTALAFDDPIPTVMVPDALKSERWKCGAQDARMKLVAAVDILCDAGYRGDLKIWGRPIMQPLIQDPPLGTLKQLDKAECLDNRLLVSYRDALRPGSSSDDEYSDTFAAESRIGGFDEVRVDRVELNRLLATTSQPKVTALRELEDWLHQQFAVDPDKHLRKASFETKAREHFGSRFSQRAFGRAWANVAPADGRSKRGRPKSNQNTK